MREILNNKIFRFIICVFVIASMLFLPSLFVILFKLIGIKSEILLNILSLTLYLCILVLIFLPELKDEIKLFKNNVSKSFDLGFKYWLLGLFIMIIANLIINYLIMGGSIAANEELNRQAILTQPKWYTLLSMSFLAPIMEELIFRKSVDKLFNNKIVYCFVSAFLFGFAHTIADLSSVLNLLYIIPYGALGFGFALMNKETNTIFTSMIFHGIHNTLMLLLLFCIL